MNTTFWSFIAFASGSLMGEDILNMIPEPVVDLTSGDAPAYWSAECGGRTYVGSYTLMMDWAQCRDYCTYFPHAAELGHTFSFADILDMDTMECLRYNMNNQYTPGNGYDGNYWLAAYLADDGMYTWDTGVPFEFNDFIQDPGQEPYIQLTPRNNYQWNTNDDQDDKNTGCLCKSKEPASNGRMENTAVCPVGWYSVGEKCMRLPSDNKKRWSEAKEYCEHYQAELLAWRSEAEWRTAETFFRELEVVSISQDRAWAGAYHQLDFLGDWTWSNNEDDFVPMEYGWRTGQPDELPDKCSVLRFDEDMIGLDNERCDLDYNFICQTMMTVKTTKGECRNFQKFCTFCKKPKKPQLPL